MSFSRAPLKRFNEHVGCAPAPGSYEIKPGDPKGAASFEKSDRFKASKTTAGAAVLLPPPSPSRSVFVSPVRRTMSVDGLAEGFSARKDRNGMTLERKKQMLLEREIRGLVQQRGEQDRRLQVLEEDLKKAQAKLLAAVREKTGLTASVTTLERQRAELKKINEFLKNKVSADTTKKRINSLTMELMEARNNLDGKNQELHLLQINTEGQINVLETDLQTVKATVSTLQDRNKDLEDLHAVMKTQNEELENENASLHATVLELKEEIKVLQGYLDTANDEIQDLRIKLQEKSQTNVVAVSNQDKLEQLEKELGNFSEALQTKEDVLKQKEEEAQKFQLELQASQEALWEVEKRLEYQEVELKTAQKAVCDSEKQVKMAKKEVEDSQATIQQQDAELVRLRDVLRRTERELDERVAHLEQKCLVSEEERNKVREDGLRRAEELKVELNSLKRDERARHVQLEQELSALSEELTKEKALVDSLTALVEHERKESEGHLKQLREEMEEVLGEITGMEVEEQKRQEVMVKSREAVDALQEEKEELMRELSATKELLDSKTNVVESLKSLNFAVTKELEETSTLLKDRSSHAASELESTKEALEDAKKKQRDLEAELVKVTEQLKEATDKLVDSKGEELNRLRELSDERQERLSEEERVREESAKSLLELRVQLAQTNEEMRAIEEWQAAKIHQLQQELLLQAGVKEEVLRELEDLRQSSTRLQLENERDQKLLEESRQKMAELTQKLQEEGEEKATLQTKCEAEKMASEAERASCERVKSELLDLQRELEKAEEGRRSLLSEVEHKRDLEKQLAGAMETEEKLRRLLGDVEQECTRLQSQLVAAAEEKESAERELVTQRSDRLALAEQVQALSQEKVTLQWELEEERQEHQRQLAKAQELSSQCAEVEHWKKQFQELFAKVKPFQEQLNAFAAERNALLNEKGASQDELNKLADAYASLLGHQNQRQKIKHVVKLKDENISLKQEVSKLRVLVSRQKSDLEQLKSKLPGAPRCRFDPSKAFQHDKENRHTEATEPLKEGNHHD